MDSFSTGQSPLYVELEEATLTQERAHHAFNLPSGKRIVLVNTTAHNITVKLTASCDSKGLYMSVEPQNVDANSTVHLTASIAVKWMYSDGMNQEASFVLGRSFNDQNASELRLRLDAYLPLLEDAKDGIITADLIEVLIERQGNEPSCSPLSTFPIPSGRVKVEEEVFRVSKELLAVHSQFFATLFYGDFRERDQKTVELKEVSSKAFSSLMEVLSRSDPNSEEDVFELSELVDMYGVMGVMKKCVKYVLSLTLHEDNPYLPTLLRLSDTYKQQELQKHVLKSFKSPTELCNAFRAMAANVSRKTSIAVYERIWLMSILFKQSEMWIDHPPYGRLNIELFYDRAPDIALSFARLLSQPNGCFGETRTEVYGNTFIVNSAWREEIAGTTPRNEPGWLLYTNDVNSFEITQDNKPDGHFFGKLINQSSMSRNYTASELWTTNLLRNYELLSYGINYD